MFKKLLLKQYNNFVDNNNTLYVYTKENFYTSNFIKNPLDYFLLSNMKYFYTDYHNYFILVCKNDYMLVTNFFNKNFLEISEPSIILQKYLYKLSNKIYCAHMLK